jgi:predicted O-methyltransferase YrrM
MSSPSERLPVYTTEAIVDAHGHITFGPVPFGAAESVDVIVLPSVHRNAARGLLELLLRAANPTFTYRWADVAVPGNPRRFEDLLFLFELSPLNRGLVRLDLDEAAALFARVAALGDPHGVEIGRFTGGSTFLLAVAVGARGRLDSIDIAPRDDEALDAALVSAGIRDRVHLVVADAGSTDSETSYDFAFIDGDHTYDAARRDHNRCGRCVRSGGLIIHHDMSRSRPFASQLGDVARLRSDILRRQRAQLELVQETGSLTVFRRTAAAWTDLEAAAQDEGVAGDEGMARDRGARAFDQGLAPGEVLSAREAVDAARDEDAARNAGAARD